MSRRWKPRILVAVRASAMTANTASGVTSRSAPGNLGTFANGEIR